MSETATSPIRRERPLSPHLQVYRPQITTVMSIVHRATGVGLSLGAVVLVIWLAALASGGDAFYAVSSCLDSWFGRILLMGWCWALYYHLCNGIRHLVWDTGRGMDIPSVYRSGYLALAASTVLTVLTWFLAW